MPQTVTLKRERYEELLKIELELKDLKAEIKKSSSIKKKAEKEEKTSK